MKKISKLLTTLALIGGAAAGAYAIYKKFFATDADCEDLEEDFEEDFDIDFEEPSETKREYVSLTPSQESDTEAPASEAPVNHAPEKADETPIEYSAEEIAQKQVALAEAASAETKETTE